MGYCSPSETEDAIVDLALQYQLVTDYTSMVVLSDEAFAGHGVDRRNRDRVSKEIAAMRQRNEAPVKNYRADKDSTLFPSAAPRIPSGGSGGGAIHSFALVWLMLLVVGSWVLGKKPVREEEPKCAN